MTNNNIPIKLSTIVRLANSLNITPIEFIDRYIDSDQLIEKDAD